MCRWRRPHPAPSSERGLSNELALAINPSLVVVRVSTYGQFGNEAYLGRPGYDALAQAFGGMMSRDSASLCLAREIPDSRPSDS